MTVDAPSLDYLDVTLLGKAYRIACPVAEQSELESAVIYLKEKISEITGYGKSHTPERIAVMAALNIAHELLNADAKAVTFAGDFDAVVMRRRLLHMETQLDALLVPD